MRSKFLLIGCVLVAGISPAFAQDLQVSGRIINGPYFDAAHRLMFSQNDYIYGTSRTAAMGGAFTSLGADLSSMNINPAGLGMYQSSDWGITQSLSINQMTTSAYNIQPGAFQSGGNRTTYGLNNVSAAWNVLNQSSGLTSLTVGIGYNRTANFNSRSYVQTTGENVSIADMLYAQLDLLQYNGFGSSSLGNSSRPFDNPDIYLDEWAAVLGYQSGLVRYNNGNYEIPISANSSIDSYMHSVTKGGLYEYTFSLGANIDNILYLGATLGVTQILYHEDVNYEETFHNNPGQLGGMRYDQSTRINGTGFTMKLGAIVRPVPEFRLGVSFHLPTYYTLEKTYSAQMSASSTNHTGKLVIDDQRFNSAPRLLVGASYVIADRAILAFDYECTWYNKIRMRSDYSKEVEDSKRESKTLYNPANTIRAGLEVLATDVVAVRLGGTYAMDFMKNKDWVSNNPTVTSSYSITGGLGFNVGRSAYVDLAYVYNRAKYTKYDYFYFDDDSSYWAYQYDNSTSYDPGSSTIPAARDYAPRKNLHMITLTLGSRF